MTPTYSNRTPFSTARETHTGFEGYVSFSSAHANKEGPPARGPLGRHNLLHLISTSICRPFSDPLPLLLFFPVNLVLGRVFTFNQFKSVNDWLKYNALSLRDSGSVSFGTKLLLGQYLPRRQDNNFLYLDKSLIVCIVILGRTTYLREPKRNNGLWTLI